MLHGKYGTEGLDAVSMELLERVKTKMSLGQQMFIANELIRGQVAGFRAEVLHIISNGPAYADAATLKQKILNLDISGGFENAE